MLLFLLLACHSSQDDPVQGNLDAVEWSPPWASHALYREVDAHDLAGVEASLDTGVEPERSFSAWLDPEGPDVRFLVVRGEERDTGEVVLDLLLQTQPDIAVTGGYSPPVVLVPESFRIDQEVTSGDFTATLTWIDVVHTWYGSFTEVVEVNVQGPDGDPLVGGVRFGKGVGPIQFAWGGVGADLIWYEQVR